MCPPLPEFLDARQGFFLIMNRMQNRGTGFKVAPEGYFISSIQYPPPSKPPYWCDLGIPAAEDVQLLTPPHILLPSPSLPSLIPLLVDVGFVALTVFVVMMVIASVIDVVIVFF